jgi:hypothetical protein
LFIFVPGDLLRYKIYNGFELQLLILSCVTFGNDKYHRYLTLEIESKTIVEHTQNFLEEFYKKL